MESWNPRIDIDPKWKMVKLGDMAEITSGGTPSKSEPKYWSGQIPWVSPKDMKTDYLEDTEDHISESAIKESATKLVEGNTLLCVVRSGILQHSFPVALTKRGMCHNQDIISIISDIDTLDVQYLFYYFKSKTTEILSEGIKSGVSVQSFHSGYFKNIKIPLPSISVQRSIVSAIESERKAVEACKTIITAHEEKISG